VSLVEDFYRNIATPALAGPAAGQTASVREISSAGAAIRRQIEAKFGAASSVALLTISRQAGGTNGENSGIKGFPTNTSAFRIYYSYTPALGFAGNFDQATLKQEVYRPHNTALFYRASAKFWPPAMAQPHREGEWPEDIYLTLNNTTFALPYQQDPLFYRALFYYDEDRTTLLASTFDLPNPQFMPYTRQNTAAIQQFGTRKVWYTENVYKTPGLSYSVVAGQTMNSYHDSLAMGRVNLSFAGIGMMYIEFNGDVPTAYYGYPDGHAARPVSTLRADNVKTNWGYYAVVPYGSPAPSVEFGVSPMVQVRVGATPTALTVDGVTYHAYRINSNHSKADSVLMVDTNHTNLITPQTLRCSVGGLYKSYYCNILFAGAVARNQADTTTWGTTASPYQVRHADQMWGYLPRVHYGIEETLEEWYDDKNYIQTHSFDMRGYQNLDNQKLHPFTDDWLKATYDGGGYEISGYTPTVSVSNSNATTIGMFGGLFWRVGNGGVVKNVHMTDVQSANITTGAGYTHTPYTCIGILAGHVQGDLCSIENCSVEGAEGSVVSVTLGGNTTFETGIGGLIGYIQDGNDVINCSVKNIDLRVNTGTTSPTRAVIDAGGLIGRAWNVVNVKGSSVTNTKLSVTIGDKSTSTCDYLEVGGLIGRLAASSSADGCTVSHSSCTIKGASWTGVIAPGNDVYRLRCGALLGQNNYSNLKNSTVDTFDCTVTAPLGRIASAYAGFGAFAGYSEAPIGNVYDNNHASDIRFDLNWSGSALSAPNATWVGGMIGWAYSTDYTGTINSSNSFSNVKRIVRNASGTSSTENVTSKVGKHMIP
jgi:hypothetical protein